MTHDSHDSHGASPGLRPRLLQRRSVVDIRKHVGRQYAKDAPLKLCGTFYLWDIIKTGKLYLSANGIASKSTRIPMLQMCYIYNFPLEWPDQLLCLRKMPKRQIGSCRPLWYHSAPNPTRAAARWLPLGSFQAVSWPVVSLAKKCRLPAPRSSGVE